MPSLNPSTPVHLPHSQTSPATPAIAGYRTLADVLTRIAADRRLSDVRKREFSGAVRSICAMLGCPPDTVAASLSDIERRLAQTPSALRKQSKKTVANTRSRLKAAFLHV